MGCSGVGNQGAAGSAGASSCQQRGEGGGGGNLSFDQVMKLLKEVCKQKQSQEVGDPSQRQTGQP